MSVYGGEFLGFQLGQYHSSTLNIVRTSTSDRYIENLTPTFQDLTAVVPGSDGTYYWKTNFTQKTFTIDFAFDELQDVDIKRLKSIFSFRGILPLIFDETPYKKYMVKCASAPQLKYICFSDRESRIYKGEGTLQLISFYPYGISVEDKIIGYNSNGCFMNNDGEMEGDFSLIYQISDLSDGLQLELKQNRETVGILNLDSITAVNNDIYIKIDSYTNLIEGLDSSFNKTGNLYNRNILSGDFFKIPVGENYLFTNVEFTSGKYNPLYF